MIEFYHSNFGNAEYFGHGSYSYTMHAHLHLKDQVKCQGPLECHELSSFEVKIYIILKDLYFFFIFFLKGSIILSKKHVTWVTWLHNSTYEKSYYQQMLV